MIEAPAAFEPISGQWLLVPKQKIFGTDELSAQSPAIAELTTPGYIEINRCDASDLDVCDGDGMTIRYVDDVSEVIATLEVRINDSIAAGCAGYSVGLEGTNNLTPGEKVLFYKATDWQRRHPQLIGTDRGQHV